MLALLVRGHRRNLPRERFAELGAEGEKLLRLCVLLRFAILFHHIRGMRDMPSVDLQASAQALNIRFPLGWLENNPLTVADFAQEAEWLAKAGFRLQVS